MNKGDLSGFIMTSKGPDLFSKLAISFPWLVRYPGWRAGELFRRFTEPGTPPHLIFIVANHFEPSWTPKGFLTDLSTQLSRLDVWLKKARAIGKTVFDSDGTPFRHTYFYPAEQYHAPLLEGLAELQSEGLGEVEVHLHHGVKKPDNAANLRRTIEDFRDALAEEHRCLSRKDGAGPPVYAFVHGNWALANAANGICCGVDSEMQILAETGCYADFTLPSIMHPAQVPRINSIYECGGPLDERSPHRTGPNLSVGRQPSLPVLFTGPTVFDWRRRKRGFPVPRVDDGMLAASYPIDRARLRRWRNARITIEGRPDWVFVKLYCHGFFPEDQDTVIGESGRRLWMDALELADRTGDFKVHFATAREAFNMAMAAIEGREGEPGLYRDYQLRQIMQTCSGSESAASKIA